MRVKTYTHDETIVRFYNPGDLFWVRKLIKKEKMYVQHSLNIDYHIR